MKRSLETRLIIFFLVLLLVYIGAVLYFAASERVEYGDDLMAPVGVDYAMYYSAGITAASGNVEDVYNVPVQQATTAQLLGINRIQPDLQWFYPPTTMLMLMVVFSKLPFILSEILWLGLTLAFAVFGMFRLLQNRKKLAWLTVGFSAVVFGLQWGQNCFLSTALLSLGLAYTKKRPALAGLMFGLLTYKPQLALFPLLLMLLTGEWKVIKWSAVFALVPVALSFLVFKPHVWVIYLKSFFQQSNPLGDEIWTRTFDIQPTVYSCLRLMGIGGLALKILIPLIFAALLFMVIVIWKRSGNINLTSSAMILGLLLSAPYYVQYDLMLLCIPFIMLTDELIETRAALKDICMLEAVFIMPLICCIIVRLFNFQIAPIILIWAFVWVWKRAMSAPPEKQALAD
mgnify:CR=1 FL=1